MCTGEIRPCDPFARVRPCVPCVPCVSRLPPVSFTGKKTPGGAGTLKISTTDRTHARTGPIGTRARQTQEPHKPVKRHRGEPGPNLNHGQDTRANRTRHTTSSSTRPHSKQQPTNAPQTNLTFTRTHTPPDRRTMPINRRHRPASQPHSLSHTTRERTRQGNHRLRELHRPLRQRLPPARCLPCHCTCRSRPISSSWRRVRPANCD